MIAADTESLEQILGQSYSLIHITGYRQPKNEWFAVIRSRRFDYHDIDLDEKHLSITLNGEHAVVTGRGIFKATINGMNNPWRLEFAIDLQEINGRWKIMHARYDSF